MNNLMVCFYSKASIPTHSMDGCGSIPKIKTITTTALIGVESHLAGPPSVLGSFNTETFRDPRFSLYEASL